MRLEGMAVFKPTESEAVLLPGAATEAERPLLLRATEAVAPAWMVDVMYCVVMARIELQSTTTPSSDLQILVTVVDAEVGKALLVCTTLAAVGVEAAEGRTVVGATLPNEVSGLATELDAAAAAAAAAEA